MDRNKEKWPEKKEPNKNTDKGKSLPHEEDYRPEEREKRGPMR